MGFTEEVVLSAAADVLSDNYEEFDYEISPEKYGSKLQQKNPLKGSVRKYQCYDGDHLLLDFVEKKNAPEKSFRVNLAWLSAEPDHHKVIVWKWLYGAIASGLLACVFLYLAISQYGRIEYSIIGGTISLTTTMICTLMFIYLMRDEYIFKSHFGGSRLFLIENKKPDQLSFDQFFTGLQQAIDKANASIPVADRLLGELKMCRRLRDEGIIDDDSYTLARTTIFKHQQYRA
ncbi:MAG: hypothetical protein IMF15_08840 [Proteobacteria bacterium]|nr:hypothetical protein [Pseudomonadota bacterium]